MTKIKKQMGVIMKVSQEFIDKQKKLIEAISEKHIELVRKLVKSFSNKEIKIHEQCADKNSDHTALTRASFDGSTEIVEILIRAGFNVDYESKYGTSLYIACNNGNVGIVRLLTNAKCTLNKGFCVYTPLNVATEHGYARVFEKLIYTPLYAASESGKTDVVEQLILAANLRNDAFSSSDIVDALEVACSEGYMDVVEKLIRAATFRNEGLSISVIVSALEVACSEGHSGIVDQLLRAGCTTDIFSEADKMMKSPMWAAVKNGREEIVQKLIDAKFDIVTAPTGGISYLFTAISHGYTSIVLKLLDAGCKPNIRDSYLSIQHDYTPLSLAIHRENPEIVIKLVEFRCDVNLYTLKSPLYDAVRNGNNEIVSILLEAGAHTENKNNEKGFTNVGQTPLHGAVQSGVRVVVQTLIDARCDINSRIDTGSDIDENGNNGETPVFIAAKEGNVDIVNILLAHGCDIEIPRTDGFTPLDVAIQENQQDVVKILSERHFQNLQNLYLAFYMSQHRLLGIACPYNGLNDDVMKQIFDTEEIFRTQQGQLGVNGMD